MRAHLLLETAIHQTHNRLLGDMAMLEQRLSCECREFNMCEVQYLLRQVLDGIANEFNLQELDGYTSPVLDHTPHLRQSVRELINEHRWLLKEFTAIVDQSECGFDDALRSRICNWIRSLQAHEDRDQRFLDDVRSYEYPLY